MCTRVPSCHTLSHHAHHHITHTCTRACRAAIHYHTMHIITLRTHVHANSMQHHSTHTSTHADWSTAWFIYPPYPAVPFDIVPTYSHKLCVCIVPSYPTGIIHRARWYLPLSSLLTPLIFFPYLPRWYFFPTYPADVLMLSLITPIIILLALCAIITRITPINLVTLITLMILVSLSTLE
jgi:hypothetical protein